MRRVPQRLIVELTAAQHAPQTVAGPEVFVDIIADEALALAAADGDLHKGVFLQPRLIRCGGDGVGAGDEAFADLEIQHDVLSGVKEGQLASVGLLKAEGLCRGAGVADLSDDQVDLAGMPLAGDGADGVVVDGGGGGGLKGVQPRLRDTGRAAHVLKKTMDFHFFAASFAIVSSTFFAALRPLVTAGPIPSPLIWWAPENSRWSMKRSSSAVWRRATIWSSIVWA